LASSVPIHATRGEPQPTVVGTLGLGGFLLAGFLSLGLIWDIWRTRRGVQRNVREEEKDERQKRY
ncbi:MAG: hypothetical protein ACKOF7_05770, partial [Phycisphaerales bacterium]